MNRRLFLTQLIGTAATAAAALSGVDLTKIDRPVVPPPVTPLDLAEQVQMTRPALTVNKLNEPARQVVVQSHGEVYPRVPLGVMTMAAAKAMAARLRREGTPLSRVSGDQVGHAGLTEQLHIALTLSAFDHYDHSSAHFVDMAQHCGTRLAHEVDRRGATKIGTPRVSPQGECHVATVDGVSVRGIRHYWVQTDQDLVRFDVLVG